jgi:N-acetylmuramoyl-L-alanine amidase
MSKFINWLKSLFKKQPELITAPATPPAEIQPAGAITLGIIVGHEAKAQGADMTPPYYLSEYKYNSDIALLMQVYAKNRYPTKITTKIIFRDNIGISGAYKKAAELLCDAVIELHFNAANGAAKGTETLCSYDEKDVKFASIVQKHVCQALGREGQSRGLKKLSKRERGEQSTSGFTGPNCLIEPAFGDVKTEAALLIEKKFDYAHCLVDSVAEHFS